MLKLIHLTEHQPTPTKKTHTLNSYRIDTAFLLFSFSSSISISVPSSSSFCSKVAFILSLPSYASLFASSLLTPPFILVKTRSLVDLPIFYILGVTQEEWEKIKCKGWNEKEGPTFILGGPIKLFPKTIVLFVKHSINSWISIWVKHYTFLLDSEIVKMQH